MISHSNSDYLPPIQDNEFLPPLGRWTTWGGLVLVCAVGLGVPLASVTKYKVTVKGQAVVRPAGELRLVQAPTEGQVTQVLLQRIKLSKKGMSLPLLTTRSYKLKRANWKVILGKVVYNSFKLMPRLMPLIARF